VLELGDVQDWEIEAHHFESVHLTRNSERFRPLLDFARLVLTEATPAPRVGEITTFSLVFPMDQLFEEFVGQLIRRHASKLGLRRGAVHLQASRVRQWLLRSESGRGRFRLKPDVVVDRQASKPQTILDTKWKKLKADADDPKNGVAQSDIYQLYAYANRYGCENNILLFPKVTGVTAKNYTLDGDEDGKRIRVEFLDMDYDLSRNQTRLIEDLGRVLHPHE